MNAIIDTKSEDIADICRRHGVRRLEVFEPAAAGVPFGGFSGPECSELGFLLEFEQDSRGLAQVGRIMDLEEDLHKLLKRRVGVVQRHVIENNPSPSRRQAILSHLELVYG